MHGVSIEYPTWRCNVRTSNTEPLMRLNIEADTEEEMMSRKDELMRFIQNEGAELQVGH